MPAMYQQLLSAAGTYGEIVSIDWTLVMQLLNTLLLFLAVRYFLFKPVQKILDRRKQDVSALYEQAEQAKTEAGALRDSYDQKLAGAREEAGALMRQATLNAQQRSEEIVGEAQQKASHLIEKAGLEIERDKQKAVNEIKDEISTLALLAAEQVVSRELTDTDHTRLIETFIENLDTVPTDPSGPSGTSGTSGTSETSDADR